MHYGDASVADRCLRCTSHTPARHPRVRQRTGVSLLSQRSDWRIARSCLGRARSPVRTSRSPCRSLWPGRPCCPGLLVRRPFNELRDRTWGKGWYTQCEGAGRREEDFKDHRARSKHLLQPELSRIVAQFGRDAGPRSSSTFPILSDNFAEHRQPPTEPHEHTQAFLCGRRLS